MPIINELREVTIDSDGRRVIEAVVRVRGFALSSGERRVRIERQEPVALLVREADTTRRLALPAAPNSLATLAVIAGAPLVAHLSRRLFRRRSRTWN